MYFNEYYNQMFSLRWKHLAITLYLKRLSSLFTLISMVYCVNGTVARNKKSSYLCNAIQRVKV